MADECRHTLCRLDELPDPGARGFDVETESGILDLVIVRRGEDLFGYVNSCPHQGTPLETFPDRFLSRDGAELICSTHGARFRVEDGMCTEGPCKGSRLKPVTLDLSGPGGEVALVQSVGR